MREETIEKMREYLNEALVYKDLSKSNFFSTLSLPAFLRDWLLQNFEDENGVYDATEVSEFIKERLPRKTEWDRIKNRIMYDGERVQILAKICVDINVRTYEVTFSLPEYGLSNRETIIEENVWRQYSDELVAGHEVWGIIELGYRPPESYDAYYSYGSTSSKGRAGKDGKIKLTKFKNFCPYTIDLDDYKDIRSAFTTQEWIDILLGAIDYNPDGYETSNGKITMLTRLLPFVEKRVNLIELAPKGTGKSYVYGRISKYGNLTAGDMTRAKMFYDFNKRAPGLIYKNDYVAFDEVQKINFTNPGEMSEILKGYMEQGTISISGHTGTADAGIILLGNIPIEKMNEWALMFDELPSLLSETALLDRFHGFIKGWDIPGMKENMKAHGWAMNTAYFSEIMHMMRDDVSYRAIVDEILEFPAATDTRDVEAVKRITSGFLKLFFPNVRTASDIDAKEFKNYCVSPAVNMRWIVKHQMAILDSEYQGRENLEYTINKV